MKSENKFPSHMKSNGCIKSGKLKYPFTSKPLIPNTAETETNDRETEFNDLQNKWGSKWSDWSVDKTNNT